MDLKHFDGSLRHDRPRAARSCKALYATAFEIEPKWLVEAGGAAPEVDRPGAVAQHLHGGRVGQEARRDLQARLAARPEDDLLPAHASSATHAEKSTVQGGPAQRGVDAAARERASALERAAAARAARDASAMPATDVKFCAIDDPDCEACQ